MTTEEMYHYLEQERLLPEEQKGCTRGSRGKKGSIAYWYDCAERLQEKAQQFIDGLDRV